MKGVANMPIQFSIHRAFRYLSNSTVGYHNLYYTGFGQPDNPQFLNTLKNTYNNEPLCKLKDARNTVVGILLEDIPYIMQEENIDGCMCVCIPRAKALNTYTDNQLFFRDAVSIASNKIPDVINGSDVIIRHTNTQTTHLANAQAQSRKAKDGHSIKLIEGNDGRSPYPGITTDTCYIDDGVAGEDIILIDDIYTHGVNIDEDAIQALLNAGANSVIFYAIAYTGRG